MAKKLTEKQQKFLDVLFEEARGNPVTAKKLAGYSHDLATSTITNALQEEIADLTKKFLATTATKAAFSLSEAIDHPTDLGTREKLVAAKDVLDRGGFVKTDKVEVSSTSPLFILPAKNEDQ
jgi:phage terminase small subunit|tara:strand:- start:531 stop:896 length:366 start_codon:yes stop_codon:yes gene_type:complete